MGDYPDDFYNPRTKENKAGTEYDANKKTVVFKEDFDAIEGEFLGIEQEMGLSVKGGHASLKARLEAIEAAIGGTSEGFPAIVISVTNRSGGTAAKGDVMIISGSNDNSVVLSTEEFYERGICIVTEGGANLAQISVIIGGYFTKVRMTGTTGTGRGQYIRHSANAKQAALHGVVAAIGCFAVLTTNIDAEGYAAGYFINAEIF